MLKKQEDEQRRIHISMKNGDKIDLVFCCPNHKNADMFVGYGLGYDAFSDTLQDWFMVNKSERSDIGISSDDFYSNTDLLNLIKNGEADARPDLDPLSDKVFAKKCVEESCGVFCFYNGEDLGNKYTIDLLLDAVALVLEC